MKNNKELNPNRESQQEYFGEDIAKAQREYHRTPEDDPTPEKGD